MKNRGAEDAGPVPATEIIIIIILYSIECRVLQTIRNHRNRYYTGRKHNYVTYVSRYTIYTNYTIILLL